MDFNLKLICRWGRGNPEQYTDAINMVGEDSRYDPMDENKKPRAGQILWIRGLTRLQTQVSNVVHLVLLRKNQTRYLIWFTCSFLPQFFYTIFKTNPPPDKPPFLSFLYSFPYSFTLILLYLSFDIQIHVFFSPFNEKLWKNLQVFL